MSCFGGRMQEYDRLSLDKFDGKNLQSTVYFLSHLHEDHTVGLGEKIFYKRLKSNKDIFLYCSEITQVLLVSSKKYRHLEPYIKPLDISTPTTIVIPDPFYEEKETVTVTLLPAFHCPGSVMFLIEGKEGTVLYTGDFRWEHLDIEQMHHLRSGESVKRIQSLYVDTTFCSPESLHIPSRQQCMDAVCQLVQEWTSTSPKHIVNIYLRAQYGHEPLLHAVATRLNKKVHVNERKVAVYDRIHELHEIFTADGASTQLHACDKDCMIEVDGEMMLCREAHDPDNVLVILPTTMYFTQFLHLTLDKIVKKVSSNFFRACYSFHSSYTEVKDLLSYLKPQRVYPNVKPPSDSSLAVTQHRLNTMLKECMESGAGEATQSEEVKVLGTLKTRSGRQVKKRKAKESTSDADSLDFGSPVKVARDSISGSLETGEPVSSSQSSVVTKKGRGRGRGKGKSVTETASQPAVGTRRSTRRSGVPVTPEEHTPKKAKRSEKSPTPELFDAQASDAGDQHSSFFGSERSDSELSLFSSQKSRDLVASGEAASSWTEGSFLAAVSSSSEDDAGTGRFCVLDDEEQIDEQFLDDTEFVDTEEEDCNDGDSTSVVEPIKENDDNQRLPDDIGADACTGNITKLESVKNMNFKSEAATDKKQTAKEDLSEIELSLSSKTVKNELSVSAKNVESDTKVDEDAQTGPDAIKIQCAENTSEVQTKTECEVDVLALKYLGTPVSKVSEYCLSSAKTQMSDKTLKGDEISYHIVDSLDAESDSCKSELREDLKTHLSAARHESEKPSKSFDYGPKSKEVVLLDSDSDETSEKVFETVNAEIGRDKVLLDSHTDETSYEACEKVNEEIGRGDIDHSQHTKCDNKLPTEVNIMIIDSDSNSSYCYENSMDEDKMGREKFDSREDIIVEMDDNAEIVSSHQPHLSGCKSNKSPEKEGRDLEKLPGQVETSSCGPALSGVIELDQLESETSLGSVNLAASELNTRNKEVIEMVDKENMSLSSKRAETIKNNTTKENVSSQKVCKSTGIADPFEQLLSEKGKTVPGSIEFESDKELDHGYQNQKLAKIHQLDENKEEEDDDVIEIVDLTGDEQLGESKTQDSVKPGKKTIKISLLSKQEPVKKIKKSLGTVSDEEEEKGHPISDSESNEEIEISSSPEWLSVEKATEKDGKYDKEKAKKQKPKSRDLKNGNNKELNDRRKTLESSANFSKKELEERDEVRRQALGFMFETDSDTDTDESSAPDSPTEDLLYDDYVELTSDSDNEDGLGGRDKGKKSFGRRSGNQRGMDDSHSGSGSGKSGGSTQRWLSARKHMHASESEVQDTVVNKDKYLDIEESEMFSSEVSVKAVQGLTFGAENMNITGANLTADKDNCLEQETVVSSCKDDSVTDDAMVTPKETCHEPEKVSLVVTEKNSENDKDTSLNGDRENLVKEQNKENVIALGSENTIISNKTNEITQTAITTNVVKEFNINSASKTNKSDIMNISNDTVEENILIKQKNTNDEQNNLRIASDDVIPKEKQSENETGKTSLRNVNREGQKLADLSTDINVFNATENTEVTVSILENEKSLDKGSCAENPNTENLRQEQNEMKEVIDCANEQPEIINKTSKIFTGVQSSEKLTHNAAEHESDKMKNKAVLTSSETKHLNSQRNENQELLKEKMDNFKKIADVYSRKSQVVDTYGDQPPPPGTEDIHLPNNKIKKISSVISRRRSDKSYQPTPPPSTVTPASYPYNNAFVSEKMYRPPLPQPSPYNTQYRQHHFPQPVPVVQNFNPNWKHYESGSFPKKVIPPAPFHSFPPSGMPHSEVFVPPPVYNPPLPNVAYPPPVPSTLVSTTSVVTVTNVPSISPVIPSTGVAETQVIPNVITHGFQEPLLMTKHVEGHQQQATPITPRTESSSSPVKAVKSKLKESVPRKQKKEDLFDKYLPCIVKKENKSMIKINIGKIQSKDQGIKAGQLARISQNNYQPTVESTDLNAIKANISALTGLSVSNFETPSASNSAIGVDNKSQIEKIPELVDRLKKLEQMQTILEAVSGGTKPVATTGSEMIESPEISKHTFHYAHHLEPSECHGMQQNDPYTEGQSDIDRKIRDKIYERQIRRSNYEYERREKHYEEREPRRSYYEYERNERYFDEREPRRPSDEFERNKRNIDERQPRRSSYENERSERFVERGPRRPIYENERRERDYDERELRRPSYEYERSERKYYEREPRRPSYENERRERNYDEREPRRPSYEYERSERNYDEREPRRPGIDRSSDFERERQLYFRGRKFDDSEQREGSYFDNSRREREFERRYREEEDYRLWLEEKKINKYCRRDVRRTPPRYGIHDDRRYTDTYNDEPSKYKDLEYEQWREERRSYWEKERYESYHGLRPESLMDKPDHGVRYDNQMPRIGRDNTRLDYGNYEDEQFYDRSYDDKGPSDYEGKDLPGGRENTYQEQKYVGEHSSSQAYSVTQGQKPWLGPGRKKQVVARVFSRSGQLISVQSAKEALHQAPALTKSEDKAENTDLPVFLTGMKYYEAPTTQ